jgi:hypothetical protein
MAKSKGAASLVVATLSAVGIYKIGEVIVSFFKKKNN